MCERCYLRHESSLQNGHCNCKKCDDYYIQDIVITGYGICNNCQCLLSGVIETTRPIVSLSRW